MAGQLRYDVHVAPPIPVTTSDTPPGIDEPIWSPTSSTLIFGERDAILVDPLLTVTEGRAVADWVAASGKNLTTIFVTHGHGDHHFALSVVLDRFPNARAVALPAVVEHMREQMSPKFLDSFWRPRFPDQIAEDLALAEPLTENVIDLEGDDVIVVPLGHTDTDDTSCLHVPSIDLVVAGDCVYNEVHQYLVESTEQTRSEWIAALDTVEALQPRAVVAGHKRSTNDDDPANIEKTREYIRDFEAMNRETTTATELYERMLALYPSRVNPDALWASAEAMKPQ
jgi:glyoxylase-like metal-dependent hydrolase (beta-lactamase superfamily II)